MTDIFCVLTNQMKCLLFIYWSSMRCHKVLHSLHRPPMPTRKTWIKKISKHKRHFNRAFEECTQRNISASSQSKHCEYTVRVAIHNSRLYLFTRERPVNGTWSRSGRVAGLDTVLAGAREDLAAINTIRMDTCRSSCYVCLKWLQTGSQTDEKVWRELFTWRAVNVSRISHTRGEWVKIECCV